MGSDDAARLSLILTSLDLKQVKLYLQHAGIEEARFLSSICPMRLSTVYGYEKIYFPDLTGTEVAQ